MASSSELEAALVSLEYPHRQLIKYQEDDLDKVSAQSIIEWLCKKLPHCHQPLFEAGNFDSEVSLVLTNLNCSMPSNSTSSRIAIVHSIVGEVLAHEILHRSSKSTKNVAHVIDELVRSLSLKDLDVSSASKIIDQIASQSVKEIEKGESLFPLRGLTEDDWQHLQTIQDELQNDLRTRGEAMISRCETTFKSFANKSGLTEASKVKLNDISQTIRPKIESQIEVSIADCIAVRCSDESGLLNSVVSSEKRECKIKDPSGRTGVTELRRYVIPEVPDRGGRTDEQRAARNETFGEQQNDGRRRGGGGGGFRRGGRGGGAFRQRGGRGGAGGHNHGHQGGGHRGHRGDRGDNRNYDD